MKPRLALITALMGLSLLTGCYHSEGIHAVYEDRHRIFFTKDVVSPTSLAADPESAQQRFRPLASLNSSFEDLTSQGFKLVRVEPYMAGRDPATRFTFRRLVPEGTLPTVAPLELAGLYSTEPEDEDAKPVHYILDPQPEGYHVMMVTPEGQTEVDARWDGKQLKWREGAIEHTLAMAADARSIIHTVTTLPMGGTDRAVRSTQTEAFRVRVS